MTASIRPALPSDLDAILAIADSSPEAPHWRSADYAPYLSPAAPPLLRTAFVVTRNGTEVLGFAAVSLLSAPGSPPTESLCEIDSIAVHPDARRQGAGAALLQAVLDWATARGAHQLTLEVRSSNAPALRLYERFGFRQQGVRPRYYVDPPEDALLLSRPVTPEWPAAPFSTGNSVEGGPPQC